MMMISLPGMVFSLFFSTAEANFARPSPYNSTVGLGYSTHVLANLQVEQSKRDKG
jgi:hypothetical protein